MIKISGLEHLTASEQPEVLEDYSTYLKKGPKQPEGYSDYLKYSKTPSQVLDTCRTRLRRARELVRPGEAGLVIGIECSRVRDSSRIHLTSIVTTQIGVGLAAVQRKLPDRAVVGLQLYSIRTFHITLSSRIYIRTGRDPLEEHQHLRQYKQPHRT